MHAELLSICRWSFERGIERQATLGNWLLASLVTSNGGAAIAVAATDQFPADGKFFALLCFGIGVALALLSGLLINYITAKIMRPLGILMGLLIDDAAHNHISRETKLQQATFERKSALLSLIPSIVGLGSLVSFVSGGAFLLWAL